MQLRRLLLPTRDGANEGPCLLDLLIGAPALQLPLVGLVLDVLLQCCQQVRCCRQHAAQDTKVPAALHRRLWGAAAAPCLVLGMPW